jgi:RNA-binding protein
MNQEKKIKKQLITSSTSLKPVVLIGAKGLTENVHREIETSLDAHEMIKIRIATRDRDNFVNTADKIVDKHNAQLISLIGRVIVIYRKKASDEEA